MSTELERQRREIEHYADFGISRHLISKDLAEFERLVREDERRTLASAVKEVSPPRPPSPAPSAGGPQVKLAKYDITVRVSNPGDDDMYAEATFRSSDREKAIAMPVIGPVIESFEKAFTDDELLCENCEEKPASLETDDMVWLCEACFQAVATEPPEQEESRG